MTCTKIDFSVRCPRDYEKEADVIGPGDLDMIFKRIIDDADYANFKPKVLSQSPWVVTLEDFLSPEECSHFIEFGAIEGYVRSTDVGTRKFDGTYDGAMSNGRTSENSWCSHECLENPMTKQVTNRIANLTGVPEQNSEHLQLLKYQETQSYNVHHDFIPFHVERAHGVRILTLFLYLNDVEAGGGTNFPHLNLTVMPKKGKALLWTNVLNKNPSARDSRTDHQALSVEQGTKYGANACECIHNCYGFLLFDFLLLSDALHYSSVIRMSTSLPSSIFFFTGLHLRDFRGPFAARCT